MRPTRLLHLLAAATTRQLVSHNLPRSRRVVSAVVLIATKRCRVSLPSKNSAKRRNLCTVAIGYGMIAFDSQNDSWRQKPLAHTMILIRWPDERGGSFDGGYYKGQGVRGAPGAQGASGLPRGEARDLGPTEPRSARATRVDDVSCEHLCRVWAGSLPPREPQLLERTRAERARKAPQTYCKDLVRGRCEQAKELKLGEPSRATAAPATVSRAEVGGRSGWRSRRRWRVRSSCSRT